MRMYFDRFYVFVIKLKIEYFEGMYLSIDQLLVVFCYIIVNGEKLIFFSGVSYKIGQGKDMLIYYEILR